MHICEKAHECPSATCSHKAPHIPSSCVTHPCQGSFSAGEFLCVPYIEEPRQLEYYRDDKPMTATEVLQSTPYVMSKDELFDLHRSTTAACLEVMKKKNHDYTSGGSVFANFKDSSILGIPPVMGVLLRCIDKFKRIQTHVTKGKLVVEGEGVLDAVDDVINYMILAKGMLIEESKNK